MPPESSTHLRRLNMKQEEDPNCFASDFDANTGQVNLVRYKADQYGTRVYTLQEEQQAASDVASAKTAI